MIRNTSLNVFKNEKLRHAVNLRFYVQIHYVSGRKAENLGREYSEF